MTRSDRVTWLACLANKQIRSDPRTQHASAAVLQLPLLLVIEVPVAAVVAPLRAASLGTLEMGLEREDSLSAKQQEESLPFEEKEEARVTGLPAEGEEEAGLWLISAFPRETVRASPLVGD